MLPAETSMRVICEADDRVCSAGSIVAFQAIQAGSSQTGFAGKHLDAVTSELAFNPLAVQEYCLGRAGTQGRRDYRRRYLPAPRNIFKIVKQT